MKSVPEQRREQSPSEEIANALSHGVGLVVALAATPTLLAVASRAGDLSRIVGASVFAASVVFLYFASTLYHALPPGRAKRALRVIEHSGIFLLIAGTYTPFTLGVLRETWGFTLLVVIWFLAAVGIALKTLGSLWHPRLSTALYLVMGWLVVLAARPLWERVPAAGLTWLVLGGVAYTLGTVFYSANKLRFGHFVWHLFVLAGTGCHFVAVMWYAA